MGILFDNTQQQAQQQQPFQQQQQEPTNVHVAIVEFLIQK